MNNKENKLFQILTNPSNKIIYVKINDNDNIEIICENEEFVKIVGFSDGIYIYYKEDDKPKVYK